MEKKSVLISGASIAGPMLAYWLDRYGFEVTVVERAPAPRPGGQAIDLRGTAREVAQRASILDEIRYAHTGARGMAYVNSSGERVASMDSELLGDSGGAIAEVEIMRGDLVRILHEATRDDVEYIFDDSISSIWQQADDGVDVTFERSAPRQFDLVVGADGLHSNVRRQVFGEEARFVRDLGAYASIFTMQSPVALDGWELMYSMPGSKHTPGKTAALYPLRDASHAKGMFIFGSPPLPYDRHDLEEQRRIVAHAFSGEGWQVPRMIEAMWNAPDFYFDRVCQVQMERWSRGRVALLGDAAYCGSPMAGNGSSMALVGAYVLAGELAASPDDHAAAFDSYERQIRDYVSRCQAFANQAAGALLPKTKAQIWIRNLMVKALPHLPFRERIVGGLQETANLVTLQDYDSQIPSSSRDTLKVT